MTKNQERFVQEYLKDLNASQACIRAGYSKKGANVTGSQLLANPNIAAAVQKAMATRERRTLVTQDQVINELRRIAFAQMADVASWNASGVTFKDSATLSEDARASVMAVEETTNEHGGSLKVKQYDKMAALRLLGQHLGMFSEKSEVTLSVEERPLKDKSDEELLADAGGE